MPKIFIYNGSWTSHESVDDLKELFTRHSVVDKADILVSDLKQNFDGLDPRKDPSTLVMPGGAALRMTWSLSVEQRKHLASMNAAGFNYLGICAGAYIGTTTGCLFGHEFKKLNARSVASASSSSSSMASAKYFATPELQTRTEDEENQSNLDYIDDYSAIGPFLPDDEAYSAFPETVLKSKQMIPFCVDVELSDKKVLPQLFVGGCGFAGIQKAPSTAVVARYPAQHTYQFDYAMRSQGIFSNSSPNIVHYSHLPAIIYHQREADKSKRGNVILSGTHIEACIKDSKMLTFFKPSNKHEKAITLNETDYAKLEKAQDDAQKVFVPLLKQAFSS